jgi:hypothetical protein
MKTIDFYKFREGEDEIAGGILRAHAEASGSGGGGVFSVV